MKTKLSKILSALAFGLVALSALFGTTAYATSICDVECKGDTAASCEQMKKANGCPSASATVGTLEDTIVSILQAVIGIAGLVAVVFVIIGGINYITSTGDAGKIKKAKDTILYALIGLIICALAFAIVTFVIDGILKQNAPADPTGTGYVLIDENHIG